MYKCKYNGFTCDERNETVANKSDLNTHDYRIQKNSDTELSNLFQVDGNISIPSLGDSTLFLNESSHYSSSIPVVVSSRTSFLPQLERRACFNRHIRKDNNLLEALNLPAFTVYNMRSLWSKVNSLGEDIIERDVAISFLSEVWEKKENVLHQSCIQELLELKGISYISTPRPGTRRGGGTAIAACPKKFSLVKLNIEIPNSVEVVWGLLRPKKIIGRIRKIILCSFYCPPRSKKKTILIDHISTVLNKLKVDHPDAATIIAGDKNDLDESRILALDPTLVQLVRRPTRKDKILSIVITDLRRFYVEPRIVDPIPVDNPMIGVPSDHNGVLVEPLNNIEATKGTSKEIIYVRPMPESSILEYRHSIAEIDWSLMIDEMSSSNMVDKFQEMITKLVDIHFPLKKISLSPYDRPWMTEELKKKRRQRQRIYRKEGKSQKYLLLKKDFDDKFKVEAAKYIEKIKQEVVDGKRGSSYSALRKLGNRDFEDSKGQERFDVPEFVDNNFDDKQSSEAMADFFSSISQKFDPIDVDKFSPAIKDVLEKGKNEPVPILAEHEVHDKIVKAKKPNSMVPGDIKKVLVKECSVELTEPVTKIYNKITESKEYPRSWIVEQQIPIPKKNPPSSMDDLRNISGTPFFSKQYESFLSDWLLPIVDPFLDPGQCGGLKKSSISHYLIKLLHFIHFNLDRPDPHAVLLACVDMSKAFNRVSHQQVIEDLHDMKVPGWLLLIIISYLKDRRMLIKFRGVLSSLRDLPGSSPQGTVLGVILYIIIFNGAALRPAIPRPSWPFFSKKANDPAAIKLKFIDDLSVAARVNLEKDLVDDFGRPKPLTFEERFETKLSDDKNILQEIVNNLKTFASERQMAINSDKTVVMQFTKSRTKAFPSEIKISDEFLEVKQKMKILGVILTSDLRWEANTEHICKKAYKNMWILRRMKSLNMDEFTILDYYFKEVRVHVELAVPVWHSGLTAKQSSDIERVQRVALSIVLGRADMSYSRTCTLLGVKPLYIRRRELCDRFSVKTASPKCRHTELFQEQNSCYNTRSENFREHLCRTSRFYKSALPFLTRSLNQL